MNIHICYIYVYIETYICIYICMDTSVYVHPYICGYSDYPLLCLSVLLPSRWASFGVPWLPLAPFGIPLGLPLAVLGTLGCFSLNSVYTDGVLTVLLRGLAGWRAPVALPASISCCNHRSELMVPSNPPRESNILENFLYLVRERGKFYEI